MPKRANSGRHINVPMFGAMVVFSVMAYANPIFSRTPVVQAKMTYSKYKATNDALQGKIDSLNKQISEYQGKISDLSAKATDIQGKVNELKNQQNIIQAKIDLNAAKQQQLKDDIADKEQQISTQAKALGQNLTGMYYSRQTSSLDILMNSSNVSDYVDKQVRQATANQQVKDKTQEIKTIKAQLEEQKKDVDALVAQQTQQRQDLANNQAQQQAALDENQANQKQINSLSDQAKKDISSMQAQQREAYEQYQLDKDSGIIPAPSPSVNGGSTTLPKLERFQYKNNTRPPRACGTAYAGRYPFCGTQDSYADDYRLLNRECVSYAAWRANVGYGKIVNSFNGEGNAFEWAVPHTNRNTGKWNPQGSAISYSKASIVTDPQPGDVAIAPRSPALPVGHAMVVEKVLGNGWVHVSQYNWNLDGRYNEMDVKNSGVYFIRFRG